MKFKLYPTDCGVEFDQRTADLSLSARGAWITIRMRLNTVNQPGLSMDLARWARLLRCGTDQAASVIGELSTSCTCGYRIEKPPSTNDVRIVYEDFEKHLLYLNSESLRVSKLRENKSNKNKIPIPEDWNLSESMRAFGEKYGMSTETMNFEFEQCKQHHAEARFTEQGWNGRVWQTWVTNWVRWGRKQICANGVERPKSLVDLL